MDDSRTPSKTPSTQGDTLDALADLFLTGQDPHGNRATPPAPQARSPQDPNPPAKPTGPTVTPSHVHPLSPDTPGALNTPENSPLDGPAPFRLPPKPTTTQAHPDDADPFHFPTEPPAPSAPQADQPTPDPPEPIAHAEAIVLGNLPGVSGPWLTQYAQLLADRDGPVALVHADDRELDIELVLPARGASSAGGVAVDQTSPDPVALLDRLARDPARPLGAVLVHLADSDDASHEAAVAGRLAELGVWTLLTGADEAALAAGAAQVHRLVQAHPDLADRRLGLAVAGVPAERAHAAVDRLADALSPLLHEPAELVGVQQRMIPTHVRPLGRFDRASEHWPALAAWLADLPAPAEEPAAPLAERSAAPASPASSSSSTTRGQAPAQPEATPAMSDEAPPASSWRQRSAPTPGSAPGTDPASATASASASATQPESPSPAAPASPVAEDAPDLAALVCAHPATGLAGAVPLQARCPHQPHVRLLLDTHGQLHLLRQHTTPAPGSAPGSPSPASLNAPAGASETSGGGDIRTALVDLMEARYWVIQHRDLLRLTQRQCRFDLDAEPTLHLLTDRADLATGLAARLGDRLRFHLLARVAVGSASTWYLAPLS